jgi:hypothetical protein
MFQVIMSIMPKIFTEVNYAVQYALIMRLDEL